MRRVVLTGARAPVALHLARLFGSAGIEVVMADTTVNPIGRFSYFCRRYHRLPSPRTDYAAFVAALRGIMREENPDMIVPTCEEVFYLAHAAGAVGMTEKLFAPGFERLARAHDKWTFSLDAEACGMRPPETVRIGSAADIEDMRSRSRQMVVKPVWSRFATKVLLQPEPEALDRLAVSEESPWVAQDYVPGEEICCYAVAREGRLLTMSSYRPTHRAGAGAGICFEKVVDATIDRAVASYAEFTGWTGQFSFDFRRDGQGIPRVLECNPRATSGVFFYGPADGLPDSVTAGTTAAPSRWGPLSIKMAMLLYGLPAALREGTVQKWGLDFARSTDAVAWPGDELPWRAQPASVAEMTLKALSVGTTLIAASTDGIEWNGGSIGPEEDAWTKLTDV